MNFGLVVCGWSGEWDTALRASLERASSRRYSTFWFLRSAANDQTQRLIGLRDGICVDITSADQGFSVLESRVAGLERSGGADLVTPHLAAATAKRWIQRRDEHRVDLSDLMMQSIDDALTLCRTGKIREDYPLPDKASFNERPAQIETAMQPSVRIGLIWYLGRCRLRRPVSARYFTPCRSSVVA